MVLLLFMPEDICFQKNIQIAIHLTTGRFSTLPWWIFNYALTQRRQQHLYVTLTYALRRFNLQLCRYLWIKDTVELWGFQVVAFIYFQHHANLLRIVQMANMFSFLNSQLIVTSSHQRSLPWLPLYHHMGSCSTAADVQLFFCCSN